MHHCLIQKILILNMSGDIKAIKFDAEDIGKHVKGSKKRFTWNFSLNSRNHTVILDFSFISGKVKLVVDRKNILENQLPTNVSFQHPFTLDGFALNILQQGQAFQLRINNKVFSHLYNQVKTNTEFRQYEEEVKDIRVDQSSFKNSQKSVKLNIGAFGGMKKKPRASMESQNWGNLGGGSNEGFPSFFGEQAQTHNFKKVQSPKKKSNLLDDDEDGQTQEASSNLNGSSQAQQSFFVLDQKPKSKKTEEIDFFAENQAPSQSQNPPHQSYSHVAQLSQPKKEDDFNTMQNFFATMNLNEAPKSNSNSLDLFDQSQPYKNSTPIQPSGLDFSTMQQLFSTNMQNPMATQPIQVQQPVKNIQSIPQYSQNIKNVPQYPTGDFNTMQNLFSTSNVPQNLHIEQTPKQNPQNVNLQDFNTMQNLFQTNEIYQPPTAQDQRKEDPFSVLLAAEKTFIPPMMNTYNGANQVKNQPNSASFGTMQQPQKKELADDLI